MFHTRIRLPGRIGPGTNPSRFYAYASSTGTTDPARCLPVHPDLTSYHGCLLLTPLLRSDLCHLRPADLAALAGPARLHAFAYKVSPEWAVMARKDGWLVAPIAEDGVIDPLHFDLNIPQRRQLRRMLRKADSEQLRTIAASQTLPIAEMAKISLEWTRRKGYERGYSMGRFDFSLLRHQRVFLAYQGDKLSGFVTFRTNAGEWYLDLTRSCDKTPHGTMHALVRAAILGAGSENCRRISLASAPLAMPDHPDLWQRGLGLAARVGGGVGLRRFKSSFAPRWERRYVCAPSRKQMIAGLYATAHCIHAGPNLSPVHNLYDQIEIES